MSGRRPPHRPGGYAAGARAGLPVAVPIAAVALVFGAQAEAAGWGVLAPVVMSVLAFSGSAQFAALSVQASGGGVAVAVLAAALVNLRFLPMGVAVAASLRGGPLRRAIEGQAVVDAGWVLARRDGGRFDREFLIGFFAAMVPSWIGGTAVGALLGTGPDLVARFGLDAAFPAFFLALLADELASRRAVAVASASAVVTLALLAVAPPGVAVLGGSAVALVGLVAGARRG